MSTSTASKGSAPASVDLRRTLVETLRLDLIGPNNDHEFASELLSESPTRWYLTGYRAFAFQTRLTVECEQGFVARPDPRGWSEQDE